MSPDLSVAGTTFWTAVAAGLGAVLAGAVSWIGALKVTSRQVTSAKELADEQRHQERLLDAYTSVMRYLDDAMAGMEWRLRDMRAPQNNPAPEPYPIDATSSAVANLVASGEVSDLLKQFNREFMDFGAKLATYARYRDLAQSETDLAGMFKEADAALWAVGWRALRVGDQVIGLMRRELGAQGDISTYLSEGTITDDH